MSTTIVTLSRFPDIFSQFRKSVEMYEPEARKILVRDGDLIQDEYYGSGWIVVEGGEPFGFATNANRGIELAGDTDVLLVNDDVTFFGETIEALEAVAEACPTAGIISPLVNGFVKSPYQRCAIPLPEDPYVEPNLAFACVWLRREMLDDIGLLDERFSCSFEDDDLCLRALQADWSPVVTGSVTVRHGHGNDLSSSSIKRRYGGYDALLEQNGKLFREKWGTT